MAGPNPAETDCAAACDIIPTARIAAPSKRASFFNPCKPPMFVPVPASAKREPLLEEGRQRLSYPLLRGVKPDDAGVRPKPRLLPPCEPLRRRRDLLSQSYVGGSGPGLEHLAIPEGLA